MKNLIKNSCLNELKCNLLKLRLTISVIAILFIASIAYGQIVPIATNPSDINFFDYSAKAFHYYDSTGLDTVKSSGYRDFVRWYRFWKERLGCDSTTNNFYGSLKPAYDFYYNYFIASNFQNSVSITSQDICDRNIDIEWNYAGHKGITNSGKGRLYKVKADPSNLDRVYVGGSTSGLWRSNNINTTSTEGPTWINLTDKLNMPVLGIMDIAIDPHNTDIIYLATGCDGGISNGGIGLLKSIDEGENFTPTGLSSEYGTASKTTCISIKPKTGDTSNIILVGHEGKIWRTIDAGDNFIKYNSGGTPVNNTPVFNLQDISPTIPGTTNKCFIEVRDIFFIPGTNSVIASTENFRCGGNTGVQTGRLLISTNGGDSWTEITSLLSASSNTNEQLNLSTTKIDIAVTNNRIYIAASSYNTVQIFLSTNSGASFQYKGTHDRQNHLANDIVINPLNIDEIFIASMGPNGNSVLEYVYKLTSQGATRSTSFPARGTHHVEARDIEMIQTDGSHFKLYSGSDGGIWSSSEDFSSSSTWKDLNGETLHLSEYLGMDIVDSKGMIGAGAIDIGFFTRTNNSWAHSAGGDGYETTADHFNEKLWSHNQYDWFYAFNSNAEEANIFQYDLPHHTGEYYCMAIDNDRFYIGAQDKLHHMVSNNPNPASKVDMAVPTFDYVARENISAIAIAPSDNNIVYVAFNKGVWGDNLEDMKRIFRCTNARSSGTKDWIDITDGLTGYKYNGVKEIVVDPTNPLRVWVGFGGFWAGQKIFYSSNGGANWTNVTNNLLNIPINSIAYVHGSSDAMYVGTDVGIYFNENASDPESNWECYNGGFPMAIVTDIKIDYCNRKLIAATYGAGIWEANLKTNPNLNYEISSNTTWDYSRIINQNVLVKSGATLTINSKVSFSKGKSLIVAKGGKLVVDGSGAILTSKCDDWVGVALEGNPNYPQTTISEQGIVELKNWSTIENAITGIAAPGLARSGTLTGYPNVFAYKGIIRAINTIFKNNQTDIAIFGKTFSGTNPIANIGYIKHCEFYTTNSNAFANLGPHIKLYWGCNDIFIAGCKFEDQRTSIDPKTQGRIGIMSNEASFNLTGYNNGGTQVLNQFIKLKQAIQATSVPSYTRVKVNSCTTTCYKGFYLLKNSNARIINNQFTIKDDLYVTDAINYPYGIYFDATTIFDVEANTYSGTKTNSNKKGGHAGLIIRNSGANNNTFYRSFFDNLTVASEAIGANRDGIDKEMGLKFRCNRYDDNIKDLQVFIEPIVNITAPSGMALAQGSLNFPADNEFGNSSSVLNFNLENIPNKMTYFHGDPTVNSLWKPDRIVQTLLKNTFITSPTCLTTITKSGTGWPTSKRSDLVNYRIVMNSINAVWASSIDNGNSPTNVVNDIETATIGTAIGVYNQLIAYSPWLSIQALGTLASKENVFTDLQIRNVLKKNPQAGRSGWIRNILLNRLTPFSPFYINDIEASADSITDRDSLSWLVAEANTNHDLLLNDLIGWYLDDTLERLNTLDTILTHPYNPMYRYQLAALYFEKGMYTAYQNVLDNIPIDIELTEEEVDYHETFNEIYDVLKEWTLDSVPLPILDSAKLEWLNIFYTEHSNMPGVGHALLAINDPSYETTDPVYITDTTSNPIPRPFEANIIRKSFEEKSKLVKIYPNPTNRHLTFEWNGITPISNGMEVVITDVLGKTLLIKVWGINQNTLTIELQDFANGIYYGQIFDDTKLLETKKIILSK